MNFALAMSVLLSIPGAAQDDRLSPDPGTQAFRSILAMAGLTPLRDFDDLAYRPEKKVLIIFGDLTEAQPFFAHDGLRRFLFQGGAVLIATDHTTKSETTDSLHAWVDGRLLAGPDKTRCYRKEINCPYLERPSNKLFSLHPRLDIQRVATNRPSFLHLHDDPTHLFIADLPGRCTVTIKDGLPERAQHPPIHFAVAGTTITGRYMVVADHSLFINTMMLQSDNDNFVFAWAAINWLTENGKRTEALFLDDSSIRTSFELNPPRIDNRLPHPDVLMPALDNMVIGLEKENAFNKAIGQFAPPQTIFRVFLLTTTISLLAWALYRITAGRLRLSAKTNRMPTRVESLADPANAAERRVHDRGKGDLAVLATELARQFFDEHGMDAQSHSEPPLTISKGLIARHLWQRKVDWIWSVARGDQSSPWSPGRLQQLVREIEAARAALAAGQLEIQVAEHAT